MTEEIALSDVARLVGASRVSGPQGLSVKGVMYDSRLMCEGMMFVALPGTRKDGRTFVDEAVKRGARAVMHEGALVLPRNVAGIQVENARRALAVVSAAFRRHPARSMCMVGITGTNGKTTVSFMLRDLLSKAGWQPGLIGTVRYEIGDRQIPATRTTPEAPELHAMLDRMRSAGCRAAVMEVSSHALEQERVHGISYQAAVFTNLTHDHLDFHGDMDSYFNAKARLFEQLQPEGQSPPPCAVINLDDPRGPEMIRRVPSGCRVITFGTSANADVRASAVECSSGGTAFHFESPWGGGPVHMRLLGRFNVYNALASMAVAGHLGIGLDEMREVLQCMPPVPGRLEPVPCPYGKVFVDYAHTPDALENVLDTLREFVTGKLWVVFGCGGDRDRDKRPLMGRAAERLADVVVVTSDNPRTEAPENILSDIAAGLLHADKATLIIDREAAIAHAIANMQPDDVLLLAGKGHETYQELNRVTIPFDDRDAVLRAVERRQKESR